ncbi:MAG TPA: contact-dependent growth inhibition system immunity protein [Planctomycetota bacterium]|nr:contact-dependent growth inhibition system immunity protein [Planctomycetota bacterium]
MTSSSKLATLCRESPTTREASTGHRPPASGSQGTIRRRTSSRESQTHAPYDGNDDLGDEAMDPLDTSKTLDELDPPVWGPASGGSYLITTCHQLRTKPIGEFSTEELRLMIGQQIGLDWLVPLALDVLERDPLTQGDLFPGDLLASVLRVDGSWWRQDPRRRERARRILTTTGEFPAELRDVVAAFNASSGGVQEPS